MNCKRGLAKKLMALAERKPEYRWATQPTTRLRRSKKAKPLSFSYTPVDLIPSLDTGYRGQRIEDQSLRTAKENIKSRSVQLYNKGPYGLLTQTLAKEMSDGQNRRRS